MGDSAKPWTLAAGQNPTAHDSAKPWAMPTAQNSPNDSSNNKGKPGSAGTVVLGSYPTAVLVDAPINYWRVGESTPAAPAADLGSAPISGVYTGAPTLGIPGATSDGDTGMALAAASSQYVQIKNGTILSTLTNATVEAWVKWTSGAGAIYCERGASGNAIWKFEVNALGSLFVTHRDDAGVLNQFDSGSGALSSSAWTHVAMTKVGTTIRFYKDGVLTANSPFALTGGDTLTATAIQSRIGSDAADPTDYWNGSIDDVALYNTGLSAARLLAHHDAA